MQLSSVCSIPHIICRPQEWRDLHDKDLELGTIIIIIYLSNYQYCIIFLALVLDKHGGNHGHRVNAMTDVFTIEDY